MTVLADSHCHLADPGLCSDEEEILARAAAAGVHLVIAVGATGTFADDRRTVEIAERHENVFAAVGVHPHHASNCDSERIAGLSALAASKKVVAIGETGLDFHYMHSGRQAQERTLGRQLELAGELGLPVVIHCRDAERKVAEIVRAVGMPQSGGVIHCFTGDRAAALEFLKLGFYLSFSGILTFKSAGALRELAAEVPEDRLLIETDAPYLAPEPYRGRRNEPAFLRRTFEVLAEARRDDPASLAARIMENTRRLFRVAPQ